jgi:ADP-heptose:LPS heptosyltransferase
MHTATILNDPLTFDGHKLRPGRYWLEDHNAALLLHSGGGWGNVTLDHTPAPDPAPLSDTTDQITVVRVGGFGDLLWLNAIYDELKRRYPNLYITHACMPRYAPVLLGFADKVVPYPMEQPTEDRQQNVYWLENVIEEKPCRGTEHPCDRLAARFGLDPLPRKAAYHLTDKERKWAAERLRQWAKKGKRPLDPDRPRIGVQLESSGHHKIKSYPRIGEIMQALTNVGCDLVTVGDPLPDGASVKVPGNVYHCPSHRHTIRESIAMISTCDVILAPDSVFVHVGAALDIPVVGLFGPFEAQAYMQGQRGTAIQGVLRCSPCHHHPRETFMPETGPCAKTGECEALRGIELPRIIQPVLQWAEKVRAGR